MAFTGATDPDFSHRRYRNAGLAAFTAGISKIAVVVANLVIIPSMLERLGVERYGVWLALQSILGLPTVVDFGLPSASLNAIANAAARHDMRRCGLLASTAFAMLSGIAATICVVLGLVWFFVPWQSLLGHQNAFTTPDVVAGTAVFATVFIASIPLSLVESVSAAFQQAFIVNVTRIAAAIATVCCTVFALWLELPFSLVCLATVAPNLMASVVAWALVLRLHPDVRLDVGSAERTVGFSLLQSGLGFYAIQICGLLGFGIDNLLLVTWANPAAVVEYAVPHRIFSIVLVVATICLTPLWPAYADAKARGDHVWINKTVRMSLAAMALAAPVGALVVALAIPWLLNYWLAGVVVTTPLLAAGLAMLTAAQCLGVAVADFWNGTGRLRLQLVLAALFVVLVLPLKILAISRFDLGWLPCVTAAAYGFAVLLPACALALRARSAHSPN